MPLEKFNDQRRTPNDFIETTSVLWKANKKRKKKEKLEFILEYDSEKYMSHCQIIFIHDDFMAFYPFLPMWDNYNYG